MLYQLLATRVAREGRHEAVGVVIAGVARAEAAGEVAANLALAMRRNGRRVRLLDVDGERRVADHTLGGRGSSREDIVQYDLTKRASRRSVRRGGTRQGSRSSPAESVEQTFARMRADTDVLIVVPPPLSTSPAGWMWAQFTDGVIIVVQSEQTARRALELSLIGAARASARVIGVVLREHVNMGRALPPAAVAPVSASPAAPSPSNTTRPASPMRESSAEENPAPERPAQQLE